MTLLHFYLSCLPKQEHRFLLRKIRRCVPYRLRSVFARRDSGAHARLLTGARKVDGAGKERWQAGQCGDSTRGANTDRIAMDSVAYGLCPHWLPLGFRLPG